VEEVQKRISLKSRTTFISALQAFSILLREALEAYLLQEFFKMLGEIVLLLSSELLRVYL
jgi:hypothetical protein